MNSRYVWDEEKAKKNLRNHRISFEEAETVFDDPFSITIPDLVHSTNEERFIDIGLSDKNRLLIVVYTERGNKIRLISARPATRSERKKYEEENLT